MTMMRVSKLLLLVAAAQADEHEVYKLKFLGDYQAAGDYGTDAAESMSYDKFTHRAFVAGAQGGEVDVVSLADPTNPTKTDRLRVIGDLANSCTMKNCIYEYVEWGGATNPCGPAPLVGLVHSAAGLDMPAGFNTSEQMYEVDATMHSPESCQAKCAALASCSYFSYERMHSDHMCYLKSMYAEASLAAAGRCSESTGMYTLFQGKHGAQYLFSPGGMWFGASGPKACGRFQGGTIQAVSSAIVPGMDDAVVVIAAHSIYEFGNGHVAFYNARSFQYISCAEVGSKPEAIVTNNAGKVAIMNEGTAMSDGTLDFKGSMTLCSMSSGPHIDCVTYYPDEDSFALGMFLKPQEFRNDDVRLYGPHGDNPTYDLEPEGGVFTTDGKFLLINLQDNNAYLLFDLFYLKYTGMHGWGTKEMKMDATNVDSRIDIKDRWGVEDWAKVPAYGMFMPDQVSSFMLNDEYYFVTANEGALRNEQEGLLGESGNFKGETIRMAQTTACTCIDCCADNQLGRLMTTPYQPSDFATKACGSNVCDVKELASGLSPDFSCIYENKDYGGGPMSVLHGQPDNYCDNPILMQIIVNKGSLPDYDWPDWAPVNFSTYDENMTSYLECRVHCQAMLRCEYWSYEEMNGYKICYNKDYTSDPCQVYTEWNKRNVDPNWVGFSGPKVCTYPKATYTTTRALSNDGSPGGAYAIGGRSFSIFKWGGAWTYQMDHLFDSGDKMEVETMNVNNDLCDGCDSSDNEQRCSTTCPFNSDVAPPKMDARSPDKGPEPESITVGTMDDGTMLTFVGLERTGGIMTYDITNPEHAKFQDFLNVRNWMVNDAGRDMKTHALNDGPESLVFVPSADSPLGRELLLAASPLAGRLTVYMIEKGEPRGNDGSCKDTATCPYIETENGGTGTERDVKVCDVCKGPPCETLGCGPYVAPSTASTEKKKDDEDDEDNVELKIFIIVVAATGGGCLILAFAGFVMGKMMGKKDAMELNAAANQPSVWQQSAPSDTPKADAVTSYKSNNPGAYAGNVLSV